MRSMGKEILLIFGISVAVCFFGCADKTSKILTHCNLWKEPVERPPPAALLPADTPTGLIYDTEFFNTLIG